MRGQLLYALSVASVLGWTARAAATAPPDDEPAKKSTGLLSRLGFGRKTDKKEAEPKAEPQSFKIDAEALRARERLEHARRMDVCNRLREIAIQTGDRDLEAQADELDHRAAELYRQRLAELATASRGASADEQRLSRRFPDSRSQDRVAGAADRNRSNGQRAAVREDK